MERHAAQHGRRPGAGPVPDDQLEARQQDRQDEERRPVRHLSQVRLQTGDRILYSPGKVSVITGSFSKAFIKIPLKT